MEAVELLQALALGYTIDVNKIEAYLFERLIKIYPCYYLSVTLHKILIHGPKVIEHANGVFWVALRGSCRVKQQEYKKKTDCSILERCLAYARRQI